VATGSARRTVRDGPVTAVLCAFFVCMTGLLVGWRPESGVGSTIAGLAIFLFFSYSLSWGWRMPGHRVQKAPSRRRASGRRPVPSRRRLQRVGPDRTDADGAGALCRLEPISAVTAACRQLFANPKPFRDGSVVAHAARIVHLALWSAGMLAVFAPLAAHLFARRTRG